MFVNKITPQLCYALTENIPVKCLCKGIYYSANVCLHFYFYHWVDTSAGGLLVPDCIIRPVVSVSALIYIIRVAICWNLQFLNNVFRTKNKILLSVIAIKNVQYVRVYLCNSKRQKKYYKYRILSKLIIINVKEIILEKKERVW
jgi:hypothetical protein